MQEVQDFVNMFVNMSKIKFESYCDLVDQAYYSHCSETLISNQGHHSQIENDETPGPEYPNKYDLEDTETNKTSAIANFMPQVLPNGKFSIWFKHVLKIM